MASTRSSYWRPETTCFLLLWAGLLWFAPDNMLGDPGTLWHTVVGERMLQTRELVRTDPFSFTCYGQPWIAQQWLGEIAMALLYRLAGLDGIVCAAVTLLAATFAFLSARIFRSGLPWPACAILTMLAVAASSYHFLPRPHLVTIALLAWMFALLSDVEAKSRSPWHLLILPPLFVLWANTHGGVLGGIATSTCILFAWLFWHHVPWARRRGVRPVASPAIIGVVASCSFLAVLVNPYGTALPRVWVSLMGSDVLPKLIVEHAPMQVFSTEGAMVLMLATVYGALLVSTWRRNPRITWLMPLLWLGLTFTRIRHGPLFAVTAAVAIAQMLPYSPLAARLLGRIGQPPKLPKATTASSLRPALIPACLVVLAFALQANAITCPLIGAGWSRLSPRGWPIEATKVLRQCISPDDADVRVFNDLGLGGYLIFAAPRARIYIDDRCELYRDDGLLQYKEFLLKPARIDAFATYEGIGWALTKVGSRFDRHFATSRIWACRHRDATAALYRRVDRPAAPHDTAASGLRTSITG